MSVKFYTLSFRCAAHVLWVEPNTNPRPKYRFEPQLKAGSSFYATLPIPQISSKMHSILSAGKARRHPIPPRIHAEPLNKAASNLPSPV